MHTWTTPDPVQPTDFLDPTRVIGDTTATDATRAFPLDRHGKTLTVGAKVRYVGSIARMHGAVGEIEFIIGGRASGTGHIVFARVLPPHLVELAAAGLHIVTDADYETLNFARPASFVRIDG